MPDRVRVRKSSWRACALREDLIVTRTLRHGQRIVVVKDAIAHRFYELPAEDWAMACELDPALSLPELITALRRSCPEECGALTDRALAQRLARLCGELRSLGLAANGRVAPAKPPPGGVLRPVARLVSSVLFLRIRLFDPEPLLRITTPIFAPLMRLSSLKIAAGFALLSAVAFFLAGGTGSFDPGWLVRPASWIALYVGIGALKFLHEMAHAAVVRHYGGRVHEVGMLLVAGLPLFYVEASDSYLFPEKRQRIAVAAAGIAAELVIAAVLVWPWLLLTSGFARDLLLALIVLASVSTLLFNANPLMRFDGYYILADALDIPDLRQRSREFCSGVIRRWILGRPGTQTPGDRAWIYGGYGVASQIYLIAVIFGIWHFVSVTLEPFGLKWIGHFVVGAWAFGSILIPFSSFAWGLSRDLARAGGPRARRKAIFWTTSAGLLALALFVPIPRNVERSCTLEAVEANAVRVSEPGYVEEVFVHEGKEVQAGEPVAILRNRALDSEIAAGKLIIEQADARRTAAIAEGNGEDVDLMKTEAAAARARNEDLERRRQALVLCAPISGTAATRDLPRLIGTRLGAGDTFCMIRPLQGGDFLIPLDEKAARMVKRGAAVVLRASSFPSIRYTGQVLTDPLSFGSPSKEIPESAAIQGSHFARVQIPDPEGRLRPGMTGRVRIDCGHTTAVGGLIEAVMDFVRLDVRMR